MDRIVLSLTGLEIPSASPVLVEFEVVEEALDFYVEELPAEVMVGGLPGEAP
jgi:hypothetical protein